MKMKCGKYFLLCITCLLVLSCSKKAESNRPIKIALNTWSGYAHAYIARENGYFTKNGVQVELVFEKDYQASRKHYANGEVDGIFEVFSDAIMDFSEGIPSCVVYVADYSIHSDVILGKAELKDLSDLKGKKIGIDSLNTFSNIFVIQALENAGIKEQDVYIEVVPAQDVSSALDKGIIDAGHTWGPAKSEAIKRGYKVLADAQYMKGIIVDVLVFNDSVINKRPKEIKAVIKSLFEARDFLQNNRQEALQIISESEGINSLDAEEDLQGIIQPDVKENIMMMQKSDQTPSLFASGMIIINFYMNRGQLSEAPVLDKLIMPKFVEELEK